jgi:hypothetical protein
MFNLHQNKSPSFPDLTLSLHANNYFYALQRN